MFLRYKPYVICYILCRINPCIYKLDIYYTMYQSLSYYVILKTTKCAFQCFGSGIGSGFRSGIGFGFRFGIGFLWSHGHPMRRCSCFVFTSLQGCQRGVQRSRFTACMFQIPNSIRDRLRYVELAPIVLQMPKPEAWTRHRRQVLLSSLRQNPSQTVLRPPLIDNNIWGFRKKYEKI